MTTLDTIYKKTVDLLNSLKVDYIIIGGLAVGMIGEARMTNDVDILILINREDINSFLNKAKKKGFHFNNRLVKNDIELKGAFRILYNSFHVDFIIGSMPFEREAFKRRRLLNLYNCKASFPTPEDLILFKLIPGREKDILDVKTIVIRHRDKLDIRYLEKWAQIISDDLQDMAVWDRLKNVLREKEAKQDV